MYNINDFDFQNDNIIETPLQLSKYLYNKVKRKSFKQVLDIGSNKGNMSKYFKNVIGLDLEDDYKDNFNAFICKDYLKTKKEDFKEFDIDLIVSNPPFNELLAFKFMEHTKKLFGNIPQIYIVPNYILDNSKVRSEKLKEYNITKIIKLDPNIFKASGVTIHFSLIFLNMNFKDNKAFDYFYLEKEINGKRRTIYLTQKEEEILAKLKIKNFSRFVKDMIIEKSKEENKPKEIIKVQKKDEDTKVVDWNKMSKVDKLESHIKYILTSTKSSVEQGKKQQAIKDLQYYIKKLPYNYKAKKYENILNEKLDILNRLLNDIS